MSHPWNSRGEKRTIVWNQEQPEEAMLYLRDTQDAIGYALQVAYHTSVSDEKRRTPSPIALRREVRGWFYLPTLPIHKAPHTSTPSAE